MYRFMLQKKPVITIWCHGEADDNPALGKRCIEYLVARARYCLVLPLGGVAGGATASQKKAAGYDYESDGFFHSIVFNTESCEWFRPNVES
jgi:hypothetical protein